MDPIHLSETQNTPLSFKSTASNTNPSLCNCGLKDYGQTLQPAFCLRAYHPGVSKCKHFQDKPEEKFAVQQPFFPSFPLFPPFFHNTGISPSVCCSHNTQNEASPSEEKKHTSEPEKFSQLSPNDYPYCQKGKCDFRMNKSLLEDEVQKSSMLGPEKQFLGYPFLYPNLPESQMNALFHRCSCGDSFPWTCSSLLVPIISYCVFWNSQRANMNLPLANYSSSSPETMCQSNQNPVNKHSQSNVNVTAKRSVKMVEEVNNNSTEVDKNHGEGELKGEKVLKLDWEKEDREIVDQNSVKSSSFLTFDSINYTERNCEERLERSNTSSTDRIEEATDADADQMECLKLNENDSNTSLQNDSLKGDESLLSEESRPSSSLQAEKSMTLISEAQGSSSVLLIPAENISNASIPNNQENDSDYESKKKEFITKATKPHSLKKFIKTFTLIDQSSNDLQDGVRMVPDAGAGDVGGSNCYGYKVNISSLELDHQDKTRQETQTEENVDSKEFFLKDDLDFEKNKTKIFSEKSTEETSKGRRNFKSGIAKLKNNSKGYKSDEEQIIKYNKSETNQKDYNIVKRRHCCFPNDSSVGVTEKSLKILKTRNCTEVLQQTQVPEKQQKSKHATNQLVKKEEKPKVKVQLSADLQKYVKHNKK